MVYSTLPFVWQKFNTILFFINFEISYFITLQLVWKRHFWILTGVLMFVLIVLQRQDMDSLKRSLLSLESIIFSEIDNITLTSISNSISFSIFIKRFPVLITLHTVQYSVQLTYLVTIHSNAYTAALVIKISHSFCIEC